MSGPMQAAPGRRAMVAAAAVLAMPAPASEPTPIERQVERIHRAHLRECEAAAAYSAAEGTPAVPEADEAYEVAFAAWAAAVELLASMPATCPGDVLLKSALAVFGTETGACDAELLLAKSLRRDLWHFAPSCRYLLPPCARPGGPGMSARAFLEPGQKPPEQPPRMPLPPCANCPPRRKPKPASPPPGGG